jgi:hypothetical protein
MAVTFSTRSFLRSAFAMAKTETREARLVMIAANPQPLFPVDIKLDSTGDDNRSEDERYTPKGAFSPIFGTKSRLWGQKSLLFEPF